MSKLSVSKNFENDVLMVQVGGRIDTATSPELDEAVKSSISGAKKLIVDLGDVEYISSSGLRTLLSFHKTMTANDGVLIVKNPKEIVREVFDVTGFADILNIE